MFFQKKLHKNVIKSFVEIFLFFFSIVYVN